MATALDSSSAEYETLREMLYDLVKKVSANAPVADRLNTYLFSRKLIPEAVFDDVKTPGVATYKRCSRMFDSVLVNINPRNFNLLIEGLKKEGLNDIATELQSRKRSKEKDSCTETSGDKEHITSPGTTSIVSYKEPPFPYVPIPPKLTYAMVEKMLRKEGLKSVSNNDAQQSSKPLHVFSQHLSFVKKFLKKKSKANEGAEISPTPNDGNVSLNYDDLIFHFENGNYELASSILGLPDVDSEHLKTVTSSEEYFKSNLLHHAAAWGWIDIIDKLIDDHGFDPMSTNTAGRTAVLLAALNDEFEALKVLVTKHHCDPFCKDSVGITPLFATIRCGCFDFVKYYMTSLGCDGNTICNGKPLGILAAEHGHLYILKYLKEKCKFDVTKTYSENTALDFAAIFGHLDIVKYLIVESKCDPNGKATYCKKPLHHASENGHIKIVKYLILECNCNVHDTAKGLSPLQFAAENGHFELVKYFIEECNCNAEPALQHAGSLEILKFLSQKSDKNPDYYVSLNDAIDKKRADVVEYLVKRWGKKLDLSNRLFEATCSQNFQTVNFLLNECHVDATNIDSNERTLLHHAVENAHNVNGLFVIDCLLAAGVNPVKKDKKGITPLAIVSKFKDEKWAKVVKIFFDTFGKAKTMYPVDSYVNVLIVGNSGAGKSTLSKVIEKTTNVSYNFFKAEYVSDSEVESLTAGIVPIKLNHKQLKNIVVHDFAGHSEYHLSHTAVIENILQGSAAVFIIVVDVSNSDYLIHLKQWLAVVRNEIKKANKTNCQIIVVASHFDHLSSDAKKLEKIMGEIKLKLKDTDIEYLDCRKLNGKRLGSFFMKLQKACSYIREHDKRSLTLYCHMMYYLLQTNKKEVLTLSDIAKDQVMKADSFFLPFDSKRILYILSLLHSTGLIYYLNCEDRDDFTFNLEYDISIGEASYSISHNCKIWVVKNKLKFLKEINGIIFSPETFKEHPEIDENGIITVPFLKSLFPHDDIIMVISFLESMGLCHLVSPLFLLQTNLLKKKDQISMKNALCLFFPSLVKLPRPPNEDIFCFGWFLECTEDDQLFPQRFFNSLTLHLTLKHEAIHNISQCKYWKNGVKWGNEDGVVTLMELVNDSRCVLILMSCKEKSYNSMISLRRNIIKDVMTLCGQHCPFLCVTKFVIDPDSLKSYPIEKPRETTAYWVEDMRGKKEDSYVYPTYPERTIKGKCIGDILPHEPDYDDLSISGQAEQYSDSRAPQMSYLDSLSISNLDFIIDTLRRNRFTGDLWKELGHHLGLDDSTLDDIEKEYGTPRECFEKCLHTWLNREDTNKQTKSWKTLVEALEKMGQREVAKSIRSKTDYC